MVGYPTLNDTTNITNALQGINWTEVRRYDENETFLLRTADPDEIMLPGEAYWIRVEDNCTWTVDW